ncbi:MAG: pentapeptide repeat-containing protein [Myxococcota bacterium]
MRFLLNSVIGSEVMRSLDDLRDKLREWAHAEPDDPGRAFPIGELTHTVGAAAMRLLIPTLVTVVLSAAVSMLAVGEFVALMLQTNEIRLQTAEVQKQTKALVDQFNQGRLPELFERLQPNDDELGSRFSGVRSSALRELLRFDASNENSLAGIQVAGDLRGIDVSGRDLTAARFDGANLEGSTWFQSSIADTSFRSAELSNSRLIEVLPYGTDFREATLGHAWVMGPGTPSRGAEDWNSHGFIFGTKSGTGPEPARPRLEGVVTFHTRFFRVDLSNTNWEGAFVSVHMFRGSLRKADFSNTAKDEALYLNLVCSDGSSADFGGVDLTASSFCSSDMRAADFSSARLHTNSFAESDLREAVFDDVLWGEDIDVRGTNLVDAKGLSRKLIEQYFCWDERTLFPKELRGQLDKSRSCRLDRYCPANSKTVEGICNQRYHPGQWGIESIVKEWTDSGQRPQRRYAPGQ